MIAQTMPAAFVFGTIGLCDSRDCGRNYPSAYKAGRDYGASPSGEAFFCGGIWVQTVVL